MGAYEFQAAGPLTVALQASLTNAPVAYPVNFTGIFSKGQSNFWSFGDATFASNQLSATHTWASAGDYPVVLTAYDIATPGGVSASLLIHVKTQIVYYVNVAGTNPVANPLSPYDSWNTAATNIQDAIDAALPVSRSLVLVTNGVYQVGGRVAFGSMTNRVLINKPITVQSANGPGVTVIRGRPILDDLAVRCVYLTNNAILAGFTLTNGATRVAGDATRENCGGGVWCESASAIVSNCVLTANSAAFQGGGIYGGTIVNSTLTSNSCAPASTSGSGGGASSATLNSCIVFGNFGAAYGGGAYNCTLNGCSLARNQSLGSGGGAYGGTLNNCTLTGDAADTGGGAASATLNNCILQYNSATYGPNYSSSTLNYCCTVPLPLSGDGNTTADPRLTDSAHISSISPCRNAGATNFLSGLDIDGQPWLNPPSIGADEFYSGTVTGPLSVSATVAYTNAAAGFPVTCTATILGHATYSIWSFGDGVTETNRLSTSHAWSSNGTYQVVLTAYNDSNPGGVTATNTVNVLIQPVHYVSPSSSSPSPPYFSWATAATNIQDAVDAAYGGGAIIVTNGLYQTGARIVYGYLSNRVAVTKAVAIKSVNGPAVTTIQGYQVPGTTNDTGAIRCVYLTNDTVLSGFTISYGATLTAGDRLREQSGGGVYCQSATAVITNCVFIGNAAYDSAGGCYQGTINNCSFLSNWVCNCNWNGFDHAGGGGALEATLNNCVLSNNWNGANSGGGVSWSVVSNCILSGNTSYYGGGAYYSVLNNSLLISNNAPGAGGGIAGIAATNCIFRYNTSWWGAGADNATVENCLIVSNFATYIGGGVISVTANNCTIVGNSAPNSSGGGGGANSSTLYNCIVTDNYGTNGANYMGCTFFYSCTGPDPGGLGNITNSPAFVDAANGNYRLAASSPCINSGRNAYLSATTDLDGNPRIKGGTVDLGAYEYQNPASVISYAWLQQFGLPSNGTADYLDPDHDGLNNWQEWIAGTVPTNSVSVLKMLAVASNAPPGFTLQWQGVSNRTYFLQRATNLVPAIFSTIASNLHGQPGLQTYPDLTATNPGPYFYRVGVY
jgi:PKD repeat protein